MSSGEQISKLIVTTFTGKEVNLLDPKMNDIDIVDIAHHLSLMNRWHGATRRAYPVSTHSVVASWFVPIKHALQALLHDGSEYVLGDIRSPLKLLPEFAFYRSLERQWQDMIYTKYGCSVTTHSTVHEADKLAAQMEFRELIGPPYFGNKTIPEWSAGESEAKFIARFNELYNARGSL